MEAGRELNRLMVTRVMGWVPYHDGSWLTDEDLPDWRGKRIVGRHWSPSTDIAAAWQVVEKLRRDGYTFHLHYLTDPYKASASFRRNDVPVRWSHDDADPAHAICLAALKAVGHPVEHTEPTEAPTRINS